MAPAVGGGGVQAPVLSRYGRCGGGGGIRGFAVRGADAYQDWYLRLPLGSKAPRGRKFRASVVRFYRGHYAPSEAGYVWVSLAKPPPGG